jgi:hypothetical protein
VVSEVPKLPQVLPRPRTTQWACSSSLSLHQYTAPIPEATQSSRFLILLSSIRGPRYSSTPTTESLRPRPARRTRTSYLTHTIHTAVSSYWA